MFTYLILTFIIIFLGYLIFNLTKITVLKKTIKKMGYGSIGQFGYWASIRWPNDYYSNFWLNANLIKPQFKDRVEKWNQEFNKIKKDFIVWYYFSYSMYIIGFLGFFYLLVSRQLF